MSAFCKKASSSIQQICLEVLKCGPIPEHVAFIMDGNRRYAKKFNLEITEGHSRGVKKLSECLKWCFELGIKEVTVYAFSIENFTRSEKEVFTLMQLATDHCIKLLENEKKLENEGVCVRYIGNLALLPPELKKLIAKVVLLTRKNKKFFLNVAFSYTSTDEIVNAVKSVAEGVYNKKITIEDINEELLTKCLYSSKGTDLLVRTSGEVRLSDFLLWQNSKAIFQFAKVLWPEFSFWHFVAAIFKFQRSYRDILELKNEKSRMTKESYLRIKLFLKELHKERRTRLKLYASDHEV
ncbi:dehydrodolichyl diphosphate synthase complex subunit DHDDS-like [Cylas formicarius]|uniref:dehydrodolichyl diphosphate synthase complex subunit DHDDS-like n=1 Tax=Cylas formicarius TaxID=197179 RepID=UPI002958975F|nr:dehydrodolichyl diphosphate synthase complex subunit DHDDS-like [Cylas formicarius]